MLKGKQFECEIGNVFSLSSLKRNVSFQFGRSGRSTTWERDRDMERVFLLVLSVAVFRRFVPQDVAIKRIASCTCLLCPAKCLMLFSYYKIYFPISSLSENERTRRPFSLLSFYSIKLFDFRSNRRNFLMRMFRQSKKQQKVKTKRGKKRNKK